MALKAAMRGVKSECDGMAAMPSGTVSFHKRVVPFSETIVGPFPEMQGA